MTENHDEQLCCHIASSPAELQGRMILQEAVRTSLPNSAPIDEVITPNMTKAQQTGKLDHISAFFCGMITSVLEHIMIRFKPKDSSDEAKQPWENQKSNPEGQAKDEIASRKCTSDHVPASTALHELMPLSWEAILQQLPNDVLDSAGLFRCKKEQRLLRKLIRQSDEFPEIMRPLLAVKFFGPHARVLDISTADRLIGQNVYGLLGDDWRYATSCSNEQTFHIRKMRISNVKLWHDEITVEGHHPHTYKLCYDGDDGYYTDVSQDVYVFTTCRSTCADMLDCNGNNVTDTMNENTIEKLL